MTWERRKRAVLEMREFAGVRAQHVIGWQGLRKECGCYYVEGLRLDKREPTFGVGWCERHEVHVRRAWDTYTNMPPSDRVAHELYEELLDREIALAPS